jgi:hypothetical protein
LLLRAVRVVVVVEQAAMQKTLMSRGMPSWPG